MLGIVFLLSVISNGFFLIRFFPKGVHRLITWCLIFTFGSLFSVTFLYLLAGYIFHELFLPFVIYFVLSGLLLYANRKQVMALRVTSICFNANTLLFGIFFLFSWYLFSKTFGYSHGQFVIASNTYQDFGAHISFIRSFSHGSNFPPEVPFFAGTGLMYYFSFDFYAGILEFLQMRIDIAYNLLSSISLACLLSVIYFLGQTIFEKRRLVGALCVLLFLFSSNLSFVTYFYHAGVKLKSILGIWHNSLFYEGLPFPYTSVPLAEFWNLNTFTNQRHLIFGMLMVLLFLYLLIQYQRDKKKIPRPLVVILGIAFGFLALWHVAMFISLFLLLGGFAFFYIHMRRQIFIILALGTAITIPEFLAVALHSHNAIVFAPGFLISNTLSLFNIIVFWSINLGLSLYIGIIGFFLAQKNEKKLFTIFFLVFLLPNIFHISSRYIFDDHKFFSLWIIFFNFFTAYCITKLWDKKILGKIVACICLLFLTLSGIISFFVIKNDVTTRIVDYPANSFLSWSFTHLPSNQTLFTNGEIYDPLSLIGKKIFLGRPYYVYLYGGNLTKRLAEQRTLLLGINERQIKEIIQSEHIAYVVIYTNNFAHNEKEANIPFYEENYKKIYEDRDARVFAITQ